MTRDEIVAAITEVLIGYDWGDGRLPPMRELRAYRERAEKVTGVVLGEVEAAYRRGLAEFDPNTYIGRVFGVERPNAA